MDRGALPRLEVLVLHNAPIGDAGLVALVPALRRRPALEVLHLRGNPFGDKSLTGDRLQLTPARFLVCS